MIREPRVDGRKRRGRLTRETTYQKVLLAVYMLADEDGLLCTASNARIGQECGHGVEAVRRSLAEMVRRGVVSIFGTRDGLSRRRIVLMDHRLASGVAFLSANAYKPRENSQWV